MLYILWNREINAWETKFMAILFVFYMHVCIQSYLCEPTYFWLAEPATYINVFQTLQLRVIRPYDSAY